MLLDSHWIINDKNNFIINNKYCKDKIILRAIAYCRDCKKKKKNGAQIFGPWPLSSERERENEMKKEKKTHVMEDGNLPKKKKKSVNDETKK